MLQATVVGHVWATKRIDGLPNGAFLEVEVEGSGDRLVAFDVLGSGHGERVLIAQGSVASGWLPDRPPVDALIIGSIDEPTASLDAHLVLDEDELDVLLKQRPDLADAAECGRQALLALVESGNLPRWTD